MSDPVLVVYTSLTCPHCNKLKAIWDKDILPAIKEAYPKLRFVTVTARDNSGVFNENIYPKKISEYARWFPMIFLVPGQVWDTAMQTMNSKNPSDIKEGVQIMNGTRSGSSIQYTAKYNILKSGDFVKWLKEALDHEDFKKIQQIKKSDSKAIPSLISTINNKPITPINSETQGVSSSTPINSVSNFPNLAPASGDVCSMRIISRRK